MALPQFTSNATLSLGGGIGLLRATSSLSHDRTTGGKIIPTTTGEKGFTSGVETGEISVTVNVIKGSSQHRALVALFESQQPASYDYFDGLLHHPGDGLITSLSVKSETNDAITYSLSIAAAPGTASS
jgi:hypothetical protein